MTQRLSLISFLQFAKTKILYFRNFLPSSSCYFTIVFVIENKKGSLYCYHPWCCLRFAIARDLELEQIHISALSEGMQRRRSVWDRSCASASIPSYYLCGIGVVCVYIVRWTILTNSATYVIRQSYIPGYQASLILGYGHWWTIFIKF